jgi:hypothetical protein
MRKWYKPPSNSVPADPRSVQCHSYSLIRTSGKSVQGGVQKYHPVGRCDAFVRTSDEVRVGMHMPLTEPQNSQCMDRWRVHEPPA